MLEKSKAGIYSQFEVQRGLPIQMLVKYFKQTGELWQINADIRAMVQHRQLNLLHDFSQLGVFDVIFCRNVLIYFDQDTKINIFNRLAKVTEAGRLSGAGRGGNRGRADRRLQALSGPARSVSAQRCGAASARCRLCRCACAEVGCDGRALRHVATKTKAPERVTFSRGYGVCIMGIDGTWRRDCLLNAISDNDAILTVEGSIQGLNLKEFFLLLSSTGLAYRRCELVRVNGTEIDVQFLKGKNKKKRPCAPRPDQESPDQLNGLTRRRVQTGSRSASSSKLCRRTRSGAQSGRQRSACGADRRPVAECSTSLASSRDCRATSRPASQALKRRARLHVAGRDVVQHDNVVDMLPGSPRAASRAIAPSISLMLAWTCSIRDTSSETIERKLSFRSSG